MEQELDFIKFKKHLDVKIGDSIVRIEYDILTDAITVRCDGNSFSFDTTENNTQSIKASLIWVLILLHVIQITYFSCLKNRVYKLLRAEYNSIIG